MKNIQMVDLAGQYEKIKVEVDQAIQEVIDSAYFVGGPAIKKFQNNLQNYLDVKHVIACGNGTDALTIAMMALGLKPGDEVITSNFTFVATAEAIALLQLTPVLVDVDPETFNIDISALEKAITPKTKAIVPVHLFGQTADMEAVMAIADKHKLFVIEDTAQAIGSNFTFSNGKVKKAGTIGHIGTTSFFPSKNLGCFGDGGALFTNDDHLAAMITKVVNHGMEVRYYHDLIGMNSRLDTIQAAVLDVKLKYLEDFNKSRRKAADYYDKAFRDIKGLQIPTRASNSTHVFHQYTLVLSDELDHFEMQNFLKEAGIPGMIYYPVPLHMQKAYLDPRYKKGDFPVTEKLCASVISLPMHTEHSEETLKYITDKVIEFARSKY
jgi:UDP-2-acetamido-2-deoxy-ribo-hexuluronate aminotransferase